jgi:hypothetical protein
MANARFDVIFLSYDEPTANENFARLRAFAPHARRVHGIKGIGHAHRKAAELSDTEYFFVVDADNWILDGFSFDPPEVELNGRYLWCSRNAVNGAIWRNGAIKLLRRGDVLALESFQVDFFLSIEGRIGLLDVVASETRFNSSPFLAWRGGFRECAKLAAGSVRSKRVQEILGVWQTVGADKPYGDWCILGSRLGAAFGKANAGTPALGLINDLGWLKTEFSHCLESVRERENLIDLTNGSA